MRAINASLWWLILLALVPILIHILIRQRLPIVRWAAQTFLLQALRKNRKKLLLETIILLLVRTAIIVAIVLVVVRPVARAAWAWLGAGRQRAVSVIVVDDSASMAASDGIRTRFDRAVSRVEGYLDSLAGGSEVAVVLAADPPINLIRQPTRDLGYVQEALARRKARDSKGAISEAVDRAGTWLAEEPTPNREIVIVTDAQASDWQRERSKMRAALASARKNAAVLVLPVPPTSPANVAITEMAVSGGPEALIPGLATTLWPTSIRVNLASLNCSEPRQTAVELFVAAGGERQKVARRQVTLPAGEETVVTFEYRFRSPGAHVLTARCESDLFDRDNERSMVVKVEEQIKVLMVDGRPPDDRFASATGFLQVALWLAEKDKADSVSLFDTRVVQASGLDSVRISDYPLIVLADVPALPTNALQQIKGAVRQGAGLLVIAGRQVTGANLGGMFLDGGDGPLPIELAAPVDLADDADPIRMSLTAPVVPALGGFEDPTLAEALSNASWRTARPVEKLRGPGPQIWASFSRGGAALVANSYGRGRVVYFAGTADRQGGDFPLSPAFVPFFQQLAFYLMGGTKAVAFQAGQSLSWPIGVADATLVYPDDTSEPASGRMIEDPATGERRVALPSAERAGVYTLRFTDRDGSPKWLQQAVNVPVGESDLVMLNNDTLLGDEAMKEASLIAPDRPIGAALESARREAELWSMGLVVLLVLLLAELVLTRLFAPKAVDAEALVQRAMRL